MSTKETDLYSICTLQALTKGKRSTALNCYSWFLVASSNCSSIGQTLAAFDKYFSNQSLSTLSLFSPVKCLERCRVFGGLFLDVDL